MFTLLTFKDLNAQHIAPTAAKTPEEQQKSFTLPAGFEAQLVASEIEIAKPMQIAFDKLGRLWVTTSRHYPFAAEQGKSSDQLFILSDFDKTGKAKKVQEFDNRLNIPIGIQPLDEKSCIVSSCGEILKLTDTDNDGKADQREVLFSGFGFRDTHGMTNSFTMHPDGWIYACHGFANDSKVAGKDGHQITMNSGNTFRFKADGSRIENYTFGQVNPFGMTTDPWDQLYTACCHSKPITQLIPKSYYSSFAKPDDGLGFGPHVTTHQHGSTGLCGLTWYKGSMYPKAFHDRMFLGNVVTNRINVDRIEWVDSTPIAKEEPDFMISSDPWFRPTDIKLGPDGALYIADFYNKIIGHYEVDLKHPERDRQRGRIWRVVYNGKGDSYTTPAKPERLDKKREIENVILNPGRDKVEKIVSEIKSHNPADTHLRQALKIALRNCIQTSPVDALEIFKKPELAKELKDHAKIYEPVFKSVNNEQTVYLLSTMLTHFSKEQLRSSAESIGRKGDGKAVENLRGFFSDPSQKPDALFEAGQGYITGVDAAKKAADGKITDSMIGVSMLSISKNSNIGIAVDLLNRIPKKSYSNEQSLLIAADLEKKYEDISSYDIKISIAQFLNNHSTVKRDLNRITEIFLNINTPANFRQKALLLCANDRSEKNMVALASALKLSPIYLCKSIALQLANDKPGGELLLKTIEQNNATAQLLTDEELKGKLKKKEIANCEQRITSLTKNLPKDDENKINQIIKQKVEDYSKLKLDVKSGQQLFEKNCANCHQLSNQGGKVGPNLDGIGNRGYERLIEDIAHPNRNIDHAFLTTQLQLLDGRTLNGLEIQKDANQTVLADFEGKSQTINNTLIESSKKLNQSPMPSDWAEKLKPEEFSNIVAFLMQTKQK